MSVQFDEEAGLRRQTGRPKKQSLLTRIVINSRLAKSQKGAQQVLLAIGVVSLVGAMYVFMDLGDVVRPPAPQPTAEWPQ